MSNSHTQSNVSSSGDVETGKDQVTTTTSNEDIINNTTNFNNNNSNNDSSSSSSCSNSEEDSSSNGSFNVMVVAKFSRNLYKFNLISL